MALRIFYGDQVKVFPIAVGENIVWMKAPYRDRGYIVWCDPKRLKILWKYHCVEYQKISKMKYWTKLQREMVDKSMLGSSEQNPVPVADVSMTFLSRLQYRNPAHRKLQNFLEKWGLHHFTVKPVFSFVDGRHRSAWLIENKADYVPLYVESYENSWNLERFAGADICHIDLAEIS
ncbi:MAG: hypothetical protein HWE30_13840 [Methylocystaceae bacterium]|nr:hypothetical protein [Methylocystaceae bacterium]